METRGPGAPRVAARPSREREQEHRRRAVRARAVAELSASVEPPAGCPEVGFAGAPSLTSRKRAASTSRDRIPTYRTSAR